MAQHHPLQLERLPPTPTDEPDEPSTLSPRPSTSSSSSSRPAHLAPSRAPPAPLLDASAAPTAMRRTPSQGLNATVGAKVWGLALVGFDHAVGPTIEFTLPDTLKDDPELQRSLPFLALPDGAHARDEDYSYFHLVLPSVAPDETIFGISCNRQIPADQLLNKGKDVTRSTVQKAIVVLASKPIFGPLRDKLGVVTRSFFAQRDFDDKAILVDLFRSFDPALARREGLDGGKGKGRADVCDEASGDEERGDEVGRAGEEEGEGPAGDNVEPPLSPPPEDQQRAAEEEGGMYMGTSLRELVHRFRFKTLMLLKLLMLQRRVMFFAANSPVEQLCTFQYSLVTLIPALLTALDDAASPVLDQRSRRLTKPTSLKTSDKYSLIRYLGLPLNIFGKGSFFQPYLPLQQIDLLKTRSYLVGTTNSIFQQQRDCHIDVIVNIDSASLEILNPKLTSLITLTAADRKWMDELVTTVDASWNAADPTRPLGQGFVGSDDFLRAKFEEYVCSLLACVKFGEFLGRDRGERAEMLLSAPELESYNPASFNEAFIMAFKHTAAYELWDRTTDEVIFDLVEPKHPMEGKTNPIEDVGIRLVHGLHDFSADHIPALGPQLAPLPQKARERLSKGWTQGRDGVWGAVEALREDWGKRQQAAAQAQAAGDGDKDEKGGVSSPVPDAPQSPSQLGGSFLAGVDVARSGAQQLAAGLGGFLGGAARKTSFFGSSSGASGAGSAPHSATASEVDPSSPPPSATLSVPFQQQQQQGTNGRFLRPLSTAAAATVPTSPPLGSAPSPSPPRVGASSSSSSASPAPSTSPSASGGGGFSGFFGGLRRIANPSVANLTASNTSSSVGSTPSTPAGFGTPPPLSFLGVGGWGGRAPGQQGSASSSALQLPGGESGRASAQGQRTARDVAGDLGADHSDDDEEDGRRYERPVVRGVERVRLEDDDEVGSVAERDAAREEARRRLEGVCGIAFAVRQTSSASGEEGAGTMRQIWASVVQAVQDRGPDDCRQHGQDVVTERGIGYRLDFHASVLHMRGDNLTVQPFIRDGNVLLWNGEVFDGLEVSPHENDGQKLFDQIQQYGPTRFFAAIRDVEGPYAFIYFEAATNRIYFARDPLGRRSLLFHLPTPESPSFLLASAAPGGDFALRDWIEVATDAVHFIDLREEGPLDALDGRRCFSSVPRRPKRAREESENTLIYPYDPLITTLPHPDDLIPSPPHGLSEPVLVPQLARLVEAFLTELERAMHARVATIPTFSAHPHARVAVLFSGGLDCTVLAVVLDRVLPEGEAIDLVTVAFENPRKLQAQNGLGGKGKGKAPAVDAQDEVPPTIPPVNSKIYDVPDRVTARNSWEELKRLRPGRRWNLVEVNVPYREMLEHRQTVIDLMRPQRTVMDLSISIAFWFAARGRGHLSQFDSARSSSSTSRDNDLVLPSPYHSRARVLLSGLGADEQLGGYARHRRAAQPRPSASTSTAPDRLSSLDATDPPTFDPLQQNWPALLAELQLDVDRLPTRNLGRDDRVISSHGKEARYPYLAAHVVDFLAHVPVWLKADYRFREGVGEKMLLRLLAKRLGLERAASLPKKAIHFGVNTAKMELAAGRSKGTDLLP
ncbi:hypothetical protein JCM8208_002596 [Rhodotorula glutinis]